MKRWVKIVLKVLLVVGVPLGILWGVAWWKRTAEWREMKGRLVEEGEWWAYEALLVPSVADEDNFFATPLLEGIGREGEAGDAVRARLQAINPVRWVEGHEVATKLEGYRWGEQKNVKGWLDYVRATGTIPVEQSVEGEDAAAVLLESMAGLEGNPFGELDRVVGRKGAWIEPGYFQLEEGAPLEHASVRAVGVLQDFFPALAVRGVLAVRAGEGRVAAASCGAILRMAEGLESEPLPVGVLVAMVGEIRAMGLLWEGLEVGVFSADELVLLEGMLARIDYRHRLLGAARSKLVSGLDTIDILEVGGFGRMGEFETLVATDDIGERHELDRWWSRALPGSWFDGVRAAFGGLMLEQVILPLKQQGVVGAVDDMSETRDRLLEISEGRPVVGKVLYTVTPVISAVCTRAAVQEVRVAEARVACALERYRIEEGGFPEALGELVPGYLAAVPGDGFDPGGGALRYRRVGDGFVLWSVGWDGEDDGGDAGVREGELDSRDEDYMKKTREAYREFSGDIVWRQRWGGE